MNTKQFILSANQQVLGSLSVRDYYVARRKTYLVAEGHVLRYGLVPAISAGNVNVCQIVGLQEEHILVLAYVFEPAGVVWELDCR